LSALNHRPGRWFSENNSGKIVQNMGRFVNPERHVPEKQWPGRSAVAELLLGFWAVFLVGAFIAAEFLQLAFHVGKFFLKVLKLIVKSLEKTFQFILFVP
jgi:hypothetical protein